MGPHLQEQRIATEHNDATFAEEAAAIERMSESQPDQNDTMHELQNETWDFLEQRLTTPCPKSPCPCSKIATLGQVGISRYSLRWSCAAGVLFGRVDSSAEVKIPEERRKA